MSLDKPQIIGHVEKSVNFTLFETRWLPCSAKFVVLGSHARGTGAFHVYELSKGELKPCLQLEKSKSLKCGTFGASSRQNRCFATGDFDGTMQIWDIERPELSIYNVKAHKEIINCIDGVGGMVGEGAPEIATGSRDGCVKVWDSRQKDDPVASMMPNATEAKRDCWTVAFGHAYNAQERCVCAGYDNGDIKLFDLKAMKLRWEHNVKNGVCSVEFDRRDIDMNKLVSTTLESKFHVFDLRTQHPTKGFANLSEKCHNSTVWLARHLPQNRDVFMTSGGNGSLNLWKYQYPSARFEADSEGVKSGVMGTLGLVQNVTMSTQPISSFDWSPDKIGVAMAGIGFTAREKARSQRSLLCLLQGLKTMTVTIELKDDSIVIGRVTHVDGFMSVELDDAKLKRINHDKIIKFDRFFVHGKSIRYVEIPDHVDMVQVMEQGLNATNDRLHRVKAMNDVRQAKLRKDKWKRVAAEKARLKAERSEIEKKSTDG